MRKTALSIALLLSSLASARADEVVLAGGSRLTGVTLSRDDGGLSLLLPFGEVLKLAAADVKEVVPDPDAPKPGQHLRYREAGPGGEGLEVAVTTLVHEGGGPRVDLVAAVHIADAAYFRGVQRVLEADDVVLYEGIKPASASVKDFVDPQGAKANPVRAFQQKLAEWFGLEFQLDAIDYSRSHFVHADLTAEEFAVATGTTPGKPGEEGAPAALPGRLGEVMKQVDALMPMLDAMLGKPGPMRDQTKRMIARLLGSADVNGLLTTFMPELSDVLLAKRNAVVVAKVREQRALAPGSIAVLYGAAHMEEVEKTLVTDLGYRRAGARWLRAWDVTAK